MGKSLSETARAILAESNDPTPDRDAKKLNPNSATLRPGSRSVDPDPKSNEAEEIADAPTAPGEGENFGAKAAASVAKDTSKSGQSAVPSEPSQLGEEEDLEEEIEMTEELEAFIAEMIEQGLSEDEIAQAIDENFEIVEEDVIEEDAEELEESSVLRQKKIDAGKSKPSIWDKSREERKAERKERKGAPKPTFKDEKEKSQKNEHVEALLEGEELSEEFRAKAETIFESAVQVRVDEEVAVLEEAYEQALAEQVTQIQATLEEQVNDYLNYVVEQWIADNEVAVESALRTELTEEFIGGLRNLMAEHYLDIPEEKVPVVEELGDKVAELEEKLNEEIERNVALLKQINESKKFEAIIEATEGLTTTQAEKLKALAENVDYSNDKEFAAKLSTLKESYFPANAKTAPVLDPVEPEGKNGMISEETDPRMSKYVKALGKLK